MAIFDNLPAKLRSMYDEGLDEVLIFAIIFIIVLISEKNLNTGDKFETIPILIIAAFLLVFANVCRVEEEHREIMNDI